MAQVTFKGNPINTSGDLPAIGTKAPDFKLAKTDLSELTLTELKGKRVILNIFPSIDTPVCQASVRRFNEEAGKLENTTVVCVSHDLPCAHNRFCGAEGLKDVVSTSDFRNGAFGQAYGVAIQDGPLAGLLSRAVVILDENGTVAYSQQVAEVTQEPDYDKALAALQAPAKA